MRKQLTEPLLRQGSDFAVLMRTLDDVIAAYSRHNGHPAFSEYISSPGAPVATATSMITVAMNINLTSCSGQAATEMNS